MFEFRAFKPKHSVLGFSQRYFWRCCGVGNGIGDKLSVIDEKIGEGWASLQSSGNCGPNGIPLQGG